MEHLPKNENSYCLQNGADTFSHTFTMTLTCMPTHLPVENDAPDEPENEFVISINDVCRSDIHQFNLVGG